MIQLHSNDLTFSFPALDVAIRTLLESHIEETSAAFVSGFLSAARKEIESLEGHYMYDRKALAASSKRLDVFSEAQIAEAYRVACLEKLPSRGTRCQISFQRTLRLPDDGKTYPLPAGLGRFPLRSVNGYADTTPQQWLEKGGVMLPMYQGEAMWMSFESTIPCALKIVSGSVNALTGERDLRELDSDPQNYVVVPEQPWLDGFKVSKGTVRQFVAMPVGSGFTASEQLAKDAEAGGLVIEVFPMKAELSFTEFLEGELDRIMHDVLTNLLGEGWEGQSQILCCRPASAMVCESGESVGLGAGGKIQQEVYADNRGIDSWSFQHATRVCVHTCNAMMWRKVTGENPPHPPLTATEYTRHRIPWFDFYRADLDALPETNDLAGIKTVAQVSADKGLASWEDEDEIDPSLVVQYGNARRPEEIRAWGRV
jgi:hypothetical protein